MEGARYWCHMCSQMVNPIMESDLKCPFCLGGFLEEIDSSSSTTTFDESHLTSDRALSLWAPILLGMMGNPRTRRRSRRDNAALDNGNAGNRDADEEAEFVDGELDSIIRRRRRGRRNSTAAHLQLLHGTSAGILAETESEFRRRERERERERLILINPNSFNQNNRFLLGGSSEPNQIINPRPLGSLGDYFIGPGLDLLLQQLAENDPNRHGTFPAQKEVVDALPTVKIQDTLQCPICLDEFEAASQGKQMPCNHKFHSACILPWLQLHSSCPVCRFQLPADESKRRESENEVRHVRGETSLALPWPLNTLASSSTSRRSSNSFSQSSHPSTSSSSGHGDASSQPHNGN